MAMRSRVALSHMLNERTLRRATAVSGVALVLALLLFGAVVYRDRYRRPAQLDPLQRHAGSMEQVVLANPQDPAARLALAEAYLVQGAAQQALEQAQQVLSAFPEQREALALAGIAYLRLDRPDEALQLLEAFVAERQGTQTSASDPVLQAAFFYLGQSYLALERSDEAISALQQALAINRTDADALYWLGQAYQMDGQTALAVEQYAQAVRFVPDFAAAYQAMGAAYAALGMVEHQEYALAMEMFSLGETAAARRALEPVVGARPDFAPAQLGLGLVYERLGELTLAEASLTRALELAPGDYGIEHALGRVSAALAQMGGQG